MALHNKNYNVQDETWQTTEQLRDKHLQRMINPDLVNSGKVVMRAPEMKEGGSVIAILPPVDFTASPPVITEDRWSSDPETPRTYNRWIFRAADRGVVRFGRQWISVLFDNPDDAGWDFDNDHPMQLIHKHTDFAVRKKIAVETPYGSSESDKWTLLLKGDDNEFEIIKKPEVMYIVFAILYKSGSMNFYQDTGVPYGASADDPLIAFVMSRATSATFMDEIDKPRVNNKPAEGLLHPNVTGCRFVHFYDRKLGSCPTVRTAAAAAVADQSDGFGSGRRGPSTQMGEKAPTGFGYNVHVSETLDGLPTGRAINRDSVGKFALKRAMPWEKVLRGHTPEECAELIQAQAGLPLSILHYAWQQHPEYFNEATRSLMVKKVTSAPGPDHTRGPATTPTPTRKSELDGDDSPFAGSPATIPIGTAVTGPTAPVTPPQSAPPTEAAAGTDALYDEAANKAAADRLRSAWAQQSAGAPAPTLPPPPQFRK